MSVNIEKSWYDILSGEFSKDYFLSLKKFLIEDKKHYTIYPAGSDIFRAFVLTPFDAVKVVILGQDPYHGPGQAHGLSFSVPDGTSYPPSLKNIFKEIISDIGGSLPPSGNLTRWADQGVLLLNAFLTVRASQPASHQHIGWQFFTDQVIRSLSDKKEHLVFLLRGSFAQSKKSLIDTTKHLVLEAPHPSPFSVHRGFFGCKHFSKTNIYLSQHGIRQIDW